MASNTSVTLVSRVFASPRKSGMVASLIGFLVVGIAISLLVLAVMVRATDPRLVWLLFFIPSGFLLVFGLVGAQTSDQPAFGGTLMAIVGLGEVSVGFGGLFVRSPATIITGSLCLVAAGLFFVGSFTSYRRAGGKVL